MAYAASVPMTIARLVVTSVTSRLFFTYSKNGVLVSTNAK